MWEEGGRGGEVDGGMALKGRKGEGDKGIEGVEAGGGRKDVRKERNKVREDGSWGMREVEGGKCRA